jgi:AcrR family transcriptional regulator
VPELVVAPRPVAESDGSWRHYEDLVLDRPLAAALSAFVDFGFHGAKIRDIAHRAGLSVPGLYHYYPSKQRMLAELFNRSMTDLLQRSRSALAEGRVAAERFALLIECLVLYHTYRQQLASLGASEMRGLEEPDRAKIVAYRTEQQRMLDEEALEARRLGMFTTHRPREAARAIATMCTAITQWYKSDGPQTPEEIAADYVDFSLNLMKFTSS